MEKESAVEKIKKLLSKADADKNDSQAEIEAAALLAQRLMAKYDIDIDEITLEELEEIKTGELNIKNHRSWKYDLAQAIGDNFRCKVYFNGARYLRFMGRTTDVEIANEMYTFLYKVGNRNALRLERKIREHNEKTRNIFNLKDPRGVYMSYTQGFVGGLREKLEEQCRAMVLVIPEDVKKAYKEIEFTGTVSSRKVKELNLEAYSKGKYDGKYSLSRDELNEKNRRKFK